MASSPITSLLAPVTEHGLLYNSPKAAIRQHSDGCIMHDDQTLSHDTYCQWSVYIAHNFSKGSRPRYTESDFGVVLMSLALMLALFNRL